ncbi:MAG: cytochrome c oxidase subunit 3 [Geminicoccaceae bacterium]
MATQTEPVDGGHHDEVKHDYHLVEPSPWPFVGSIAALFLTFGLVLWMHDYAGGMLVTLLGLAGVIATMAFWWRDVLKESRSGDHSQTVSFGLRLGMILFITSEVCFFAAFFWAYFWGALVPPDTVATAWPPQEIAPVDAYSIPLLNTLILLLSGTTVTWAHHTIREGDNETAFKALALTVGLGVIFLGFQIYEYVHAIHLGLTLQSGVFGSTFYMATGFHGFHVFVGAVFLAVCTWRAYNLALRAEKHIGFEAAAWYWHFVDVVWLFLFICVYVWGGAQEFVNQPVPGS